MMQNGLECRSQSPFFAIQPQRVVILGASNVALSIATIYRTLRCHFGQPIELLAAMGHGRSYGNESSVLGRRLPAILDCGLWQALEDRESRPTKVLVTDIGNDLIYGQSAETLLDWVFGCVDRLSAPDHEIIITQLPLANLDRISNSKFRMMKTIFFPSCDVELAKIISRAKKISAAIEQHAQTRNIRLIVPQTSWYGWDPVHVRRRCRAHVWQTFLDFKADNLQEAEPCRLSLWQRLRFNFYAPEQRIWLGMKQHKTQPVARFSDGSTVSLF